MATLTPIVTMRRTRRAARLLPLRRAATAALAVFASALAHDVAALEFECSQPGDTRHLRVDLPGEDHLCEVSVTGEAGERRVMWYADHESLYCSAKAYELRDKYVETWQFDCEEWPDRDGIDRLSARHRAILDIQLKSLRARAEAGEPEVEVTGVRAVASTLLERRDGFLALQFFRADGSDFVRVVIDEAGGWRTVLELDDLAAQVSPLDEIVVTDAFIEHIGESGALEVVTLLAPGGAAVGSDRADLAPVCEGRQTLRTDAASGLEPSSPHRHVCDTGTAGDPG